MHTVSKTFSFCYGHKLLNDEGKCRHLHGHTAKATIVMGSEKLDENGMVVHFDRLKDTIGKWISENLDHHLILFDKDPLAPELKRLGERFLEIPANPTAENIAKLIFNKCQEFELPVASVNVWESETSRATYTK